MGVATADYNADGWLDIFKTNFSDESASLYRGSGDGFFVEDSEAAGVGRNKKWVGWGCGFADFDNDGWPDLFVVNGHVYPEIDKAGRGSFLQPRVLYRNLGNGRFMDVSATAGAPVSAPSSSRGVAFGDLDNDGAMDVVVNNMNALPSLLKLEAKPQNHWFAIQGHRSEIQSQRNRGACRLCHGQTPADGRGPQRRKPLLSKRSPHPLRSRRIRPRRSHRSTLAERRRGPAP